MINISFQSITQRTRMKRASTQRERRAERMRHTERMRKTTTAKTANMGNQPLQKAATPPTKAHTKRTATYTTKPTNDHFIQNFMPVGAKPKPRFKSCCISVLFFITLTFFFMPCRWPHLARFREQIRTGRKYARLLVKIFQPPRWTD